MLRPSLDFPDAKRDAVSDFGKGDGSANVQNKIAAIKIGAFRENRMVGVDIAASAGRGTGLNCTRI